MTAPASILLCDHRGAGLEELARGLEESGREVLCTHSLRQSLAEIARARPGVLVLEPLARGPVELETLARARAGEAPLPVLVITDPGDDALASLGSVALELGPIDFLRRGASPEELLLRIDLLGDQARRRIEMEELRHRATHDDRTDLLRPLEFDAQLRRYVSAAGRHRLDLALLLLDLDRFGQVNKRYSHTVGDAIIARVGEVIRQALRVEDVAGRLGGDEFAVILPYTRRVDAAIVVQRLLTEIAALSGNVPGADDELVVSASIGFETFDGGDLDSLELLRAHAEVALRTAKRRGGDQGVYFRNLEAEGGATE